MKMYIGLDVHSKQTTFCAQDCEGTVIKEGRVPTSNEGFEDLLERLDAPEGAAIGLETGTQANWVARRLSMLGMNPVVIDAREVRLKARRVGQKSDRRDAFEICDGLRRGIYTGIVYVPSPEVERLRRIISRRRHFIKVRTGQVNAVKYQLRSLGLGDKAKTLTTVAAWEKLLAQTLPDWLGQHIALHFQVWRVVQENIEELEEELKQALGPFAEEMRLLSSAPGVGPITAATFIAVIARPERFAHSGKVVSYCGLAPSTYDSGGRERHGRITKRGSAELRSMLCEAAHHAGKPQHPLNPYFVRVCARQGYKRAIVAVAHRLARILYRMWLNREEFDESKLNVTYEKKEKTRTVYYRIRKPGELARQA